MADDQHTNYRRIANTIEYIRDNFKQQPSLDEIASAVGVSPFHLQRLFTEWAGVSPKKFIQYLSIEYAKYLLQEKHTSILETTFQTGFSSTSRLHDLFINIEGMTPGEYKNGGSSLHINYHFTNSPFGRVIIASTGKGICHIHFEDSEEQALRNLKHQFPKAHYGYCSDENQQQALIFFLEDWRQTEKIRLHVKCSDFQLKVWQALLKIPRGKLSTYGEMAKTIGRPKAARAVGTAIGNNPVALLIPCHRVIQNTGAIGGYMWGNTRKSAIIGWEASREENTASEV